MTMTKEALSKEYSLFTFGRNSGLGQLLSPSMHDEVYYHISKLNEVPITKVQLNQLLVISQAGGVSDGFFQYYWKEAADSHPYDVKKVQFFDETWITGKDQTIVSHDHLRWGLYRIFIDGLLYFGNVIAGFKSLRSLPRTGIADFFSSKRFDTAAFAARGPCLPLKTIPKDDRYLISEMACKTFGEVPEDAEQARQMLHDALKRYRETKGGPVQFKQLLEELVGRGENNDQLMLSFDDVLAEDVKDADHLTKTFNGELAKFLTARESAVKNTALYLSMVNDLDVYVATSMRNRQNFRDMATACEKIFGDPKLTHLHLRYFDPTMSAAKGHEDKGLIECLMVQCAKVLVYCEGEKESYGKDAEAAMALSLGKPVIFYCDRGKKTMFYRDVHPLARLIDFRSGVAVGAIVSDDVMQVAELLKRTFENTMEYRIEHHEKRVGYLKLVEKLTESVVRLQTDDDLLASTFWNNYHNRQHEGFISLVAGKEAEWLHE